MKKNNLLILKITSLILCFLMIVSCFIPFKVNISVNPNYDEYAYRSLFLYLFYPGSNMSILNLELYVFFGSLTIGSLLLTPILFMFSNIKSFNFCNCRVSFWPINYDSMFSYLWIWICIFYVFVNNIYLYFSYLSYSKKKK